MTMSVIRAFGKAIPWFSAQPLSRDVLSVIQSLMEGSIGIASDSSNV
jgi:hypothetical protein